jgi:capsid portal protein
MMNRKLLADMGIRFWRFRSQTPVTRDPERLTAMVEKLMRAGVLIPEEGRVLASDIFNRELRKISDEWVKLPLTLTLAKYQNQIIEQEPTEDENDALLDDARNLIKLRDRLSKEESRLSEKRMKTVREFLSGNDS